MTIFEALALSLEYLAATAQLFALTLVLVEGFMLLLIRILPVPLHAIVEHFACKLHAVADFIFHHQLGTYFALVHVLDEVAGPLLSLNNLAVYVTESIVRQHLQPLQLVLDVELLDGFLGVLLNQKIQLVAVLEGE